MEEDKFPRMRLSPSPDRIHRADMRSSREIRSDPRRSGAYERLGGMSTPQMASPITPIMVTRAFGSGRRSPSPDSARIELRPLFERARKRMSPTAADPAPIILPAYQPKYESPSPGYHKVTSPRIITPPASPSRATRTPAPEPWLAPRVSVPPATISANRVVDMSNMDAHSMSLRVVQPVWHGQRTPPHPEWDRRLYDKPVERNVVPKKTPTPVERHIDPVPLSPPVDEPAMTMDQMSDRLSDRQSAVGSLAVAPTHDPRNCTGADFIKQLFFLRGIDDPAAMEPWLSDQRLCDDWTALGSILVPLTRYGLRAGPQRKWMNVMPFVDKHRRLFPWLIWFNSPTLEGDYADMCPLNELRSFKAGVGASTDPAFAEYRDGDDLFGAVIDDRDPNRPKRVKYMLNGCMVLTFRDRVVQFHCNRVPEYDTLSRVLCSAVRINKAAVSVVGTPRRSQGPGSSHHTAAVRESGLTWEEYFKQNPAAAYNSVNASPSPQSAHVSGGHHLIQGAAMNSVKNTAANNTSPGTVPRTGVRGGTV